MVAEPAESPFHGASLNRKRIVERLYIVRRFRQTAAQQPFHNYHRNTEFSCKLKSFRTGLVIDVHKIILNLDHIPVISLKNIFKLLIGAVERKTFIADLSGSLHIVEEFRSSDGLEILPFLLVDSMHQIKIDMIRLKFFQLGFQQRFHLRAVMHMFRRHLRGDCHPVAIPVLQGFSKHDLRSFVQVDVCGIQIGHASVDCLPDERDGLLLVDNAVARRCAVKAHAAQAECRCPDVQFTHAAIFHLLNPPYITCGYPKKTLRTGLSYPRPAAAV